MIDSDSAVRSRATSAFAATAARAPHRLNTHPREAAIPIALLMAQASAFWDRLERKDKRAVERFARLAQLWADAHGRVTPALQSALTAIEHQYAAAFTAGARRAWQGLLARVGARTSLPILTPAESTPYWLKDGHPMVGWGSQDPLPVSADVVIIGAGLTGVAAAYALATDPRAAGLRTVLLEAGDIGTQASGRNGGNFQILPENCYGNYAGIVCERAKFLRALHLRTAPALLQDQAEQQARIVLQVALRNRAILLENVRRAAIDADLSRQGAFHIALTASEEQGLVADVHQARALGVPMEILTPAQLDTLMELPPGTNRFSGRFCPLDGNYHPFKYVVGLAKATVAEGAQIFAHTGVSSLSAHANGGYTVHTARGAIRSATVIVATNAFTSRLLPQLTMVQPYRSQVMVTEHAPQRWDGRTLTSDLGDLYGHYPSGEAYRDEEGVRRGPLLLGGGRDRPFASPEKARRSHWVHKRVMRQRDAIAPELAGIPPSRAWAGPMAFTPDRLPLVGAWQRGLIVAVGFNGYGGTFTQAAAHAAVEIALTGSHPAWMPREMFCPRRFQT
jgi:glycine/D-amino acid oxidase-like deaminating enzyme